VDTYLISPINMGYRAVVCVRVGALTTRSSVLQHADAKMNSFIPNGVLGVCVCGLLLANQVTATSCFQYFRQQGSQGSALDQPHSAS
jgi:hypothetical protein